MFSSLTLAAFSALLTLVHGAPTPSLIGDILRQVTGPTLADQYIVKLKEGVSTDAHISSLPFAFSVEDTSSPITHSFLSDFFQGYAGKFVGAELDALKANPDVEYIEPNAIFSIVDTQANAPWNLQAISTQQPVGGSDTASIKYSYSFSKPAGDNVDIYIVDTGVSITNVEFGGRATWGHSAGSLPQADGHGHGTHCAGSAAGKTYGVAKNANIIAVKVLGDNGSGNTADIVDGLGWVLTNAQKTGKPSVASMSLGGGTSQALDDAVQKLLDGGVTVTVAAGNDGKDASSTSPAHVPDAITVGASDITNKIASFSNFGSVVDVFAPGVKITSAWIGNDTAVNTISGTSMATPQVAGLAAYFLSKEPALKPAAVAAKIVKAATPNAVSGVPSGTTSVLVYNGGAGGGDSTPAPSSTDAVPTADPTSEDPLPSPTSTSSSSSPLGGLSDLFTCPSWWANCPWGSPYNG